MTVLFKVPPPAQLLVDEVRVAAKVFGEVDLAVGDRAFLWWSEAQGGSGLVARGIVRACERIGRDLAASIGIEDEIARPFGKDDLAPYRESQTAEPLASLARCLYRHALNKVIMISPEEEGFLDAFFD